MCISVEQLHFSNNVLNATRRTFHLANMHPPHNFPSTKNDTEQIVYSHIQCSCYPTYKCQIIWHEVQAHHCAFREKKNEFLNEATTNINTAGRGGGGKRWKDEWKKSTGADMSQQVTGVDDVQTITIKIKIPKQMAMAFYSDRRRILYSVLWCLYQCVTINFFFNIHTLSLIFFVPPHLVFYFHFSRTLAHSSIFKFFSLVNIAGKKDARKDERNESIKCKSWQYDASNKRVQQQL